METHSLKIAQTSITPSCTLDWDKNTLNMKGRSSPCSSMEFYSPITEKIVHAFRQGRKSLTANFEFEYFNTSSSKCIYDLLKKLSIAQNNGADVIVNWFYEEDDEDMRETGEDYEEILGLNFNYIPV